MRVKEAIVCVDDDAIILLSLKQELMDYFEGRYIIETALNPEKAFELIDHLYQRGTLVKLIISDWLMPEMKGDKFLSAVKDKYSDIKFIIISGMSDRVAINDAFKTIGLGGYVEKPWESNILIDTIKSILE